MKTINIQLAILFLLTFTISGFCQKLASNDYYNYKSMDPVEWALALDAVIAAPKNHKIILENDTVRVLEVTIAPGESENLHHHKWPSVIYFQEADEFIDKDVDGKIIFDSRKLKAPSKTPMTIWKDSEAAHSISNLSNTKSIKLIRVEVKQ
ncbi:hypothetical protein [Algibacter sp.]|uniref:hypothetical protein n=1 Tax=Algibacter sp. TaxID=1872428 RepID=UPI003C71B7F0